MSKVTIAETKTTLTSGTYQIKNDGTYTLTFTFKNSQFAPVTKRFALQNGYDFSQGLNMTTWNPSTRYLEIKFNQKYINFLENGWHNEEGNYKLLSWLNIPITLGKNPPDWIGLISQNSLLNTINNFIPTPPPTPTQPAPDTTFNQLDRQVTWPLTGGEEDDYLWGLQNKINELNPTKGLILKLKIDNTRHISQANDPSIGEIPLNPITSGEATHQFKSNYWDQILFNQ